MVARTARAAGMVLMICYLTALPALSDPPRGWTEEKCAIYRRDWAEALSRWGSAGLSDAFLNKHEAFIDGGCMGPAMVCPRLARELELANVMTVRAMNAGMASTFLPFACPGKQ